jgi:hypothetical protein
MRVLGLALAGGLVVTATLAAHAAPLGSNMARLATGAAPGIVQAWVGCGWGWHPVPGHWSQWRGGWVPPHCAPNRYYGGWGPYGGGQGPYGGWRYDGGWGGSYGGWRGSDGGS